MNDHNGREIRVGDHVRHVYEPLPPKAPAERGLGPHCHYFFGVARVVELATQVAVVRGISGGGVFLGSFLEVVDGPVCSRPYLVPLGATLHNMNAA